LSIQKSIAKNCVAADSEIGGQKLFCYRFRNRQHNCVAVDLEIDSQLCRCRQPKIMSLPIQKSTAKNCVATDSEIGIQKLFYYLFRIRQQNCVAADSEIDNQLCRCRFRNRQPKTVPLLTQKSTAMVESFRLSFSLLLLFWLFTKTQRLFEQICESSYFTFDALNFLLIMSLYLSPFFIFYLFSQSSVVNLR
jgi:hypothetical protein